jgi:hypothetical protein
LGSPWTSVGTPVSGGTLAYKKPKCLTSSLLPAADATSRQRSSSAVMDSGAPRTSSGGCRSTETIASHHCCVKAARRLPSVAASYGATSHSLKGSPLPPPSGRTAHRARPRLRTGIAPPVRAERRGDHAIPQTTRTGPAYRGPARRVRLATAAFAGRDPAPLQPVGLVGVTDRHRHHACDPLTFLQVSAHGRQDVLGITIHHASPVRFGRLGRRNLVFDWALTGQAQMVIGRRAVPSTDDESRFAPRCLRR